MSLFKVDWSIIRDGCQKVGTELVDQCTLQSFDTFLYVAYQSGHSDYTIRFFVLLLLQLALDGQSKDGVGARAPLIQLCLSHTAEACKTAAEKSVNPTLTVLHKATIIT